MAAPQGEQLLADNIYASPINLANKELDILGKTALHYRISHTNFSRLIQGQYVVILRRKLGNPNNPAVVFDPSSSRMIDISMPSVPNAHQFFEGEIGIKKSRFPMYVEETSMGHQWSNGHQAILQIPTETRLNDRPFRPYDGDVNEVLDDIFAGNGYNLGSDCHTISFGVKFTASELAADAEDFEREYYGFHFLRMELNVMTTTGQFERHVVVAAKIPSTEDIANTEVLCQPLEEEFDVSQYESSGEHGTQRASRDVEYYVPQSYTPWTPYQANLTIQNCFVGQAWRPHSLELFLLKNEDQLECIWQVSRLHSTYSGPDQRRLRFARYVIFRRNMMNAENDMRAAKVIPRVEKHVRRRKAIVKEPVQEASQAGESVGKRVEELGDGAMDVNLKTKNEPKTKGKHAEVKEDIGVMETGVVVEKSGNSQVLKRKSEEMEKNDAEHETSDTKMQEA